MRLLNGMKPVNQSNFSCYLLIDEPAWQGYSDAVDAARVKKVCIHVLQVVAPDMPACEVSLRLTDDDEIQALNRDYRGKDKPTNVLSFPLIEDFNDLADLPTPIMLGDIVIAYGVVATEAKDQDKAFADHVTHLLVHGLLHLLGYDHETDSDAEVMETLEIDILAALGVQDPYAV